MIHFPERIQKLRVIASLELKSTLELETGVRDALVQEQLDRIKSWLGDIETFFLWHVLKDEMTAAMEAAWLRNAEMMLSVASSQLQQVKPLAAQHGSDLESRSG